MYGTRGEGFFWRTGRAAVVRQGGCVAAGACAAEGDLRGTSESDVLRRGQPRAGAREQAEGKGQVKARDLQEGLREAKGEVPKEVRGETL
jgi:hypothetical protein